MTRILVGNDFSEDVRSDRGWTGWWVQRLVWFAEDGDILLLPSAPEPAFLDYVTGLTGVRVDTLRFVVPPAAESEPNTLSPARLTDLRTLADLRAAIAGEQVTEVVALWPDAAVATLVSLLGVEKAMAGHGFVSQSGGLLVNSKSMFRAIAGGTGVPIPDGAVCTSKAVAEEAILSLLDGGEPVIIKHDFLSGGRGNEILSTEGGFRPLGARRVVVVDGRAAARAYLNENWGWLSGDGRGRPVAERYHRDSSAFFVEFDITDQEIVYGGTGELLSAPYAVGQVMPAAGLPQQAVDALVDGGRKLAQALHAIGYRGVLGPDSIITPDGEILFTEYNGRITGSTHIYGRIGARVVGDGFGKDRVILERVWPEGWAVSGFIDAVDRLVAAGVAYDPATRSGVVLTNAFDNNNGVMYCVVAPDMDQAWAVDRGLREVFAAHAV